MSARNLPVAATSLVEMVAYQPGTIVSRTLLKNKGGNITLFAFAAGEGLSEHTAPFDAQVILLDGAATVSVAGEAHSLTTGDTITLPANIPHAVGATTAMKMLLVMIKGETLA